MSTTAPGVLAGEFSDSGGRSLGARTRAYFASDAARMVQTVLGLIWLLDGGLQFQSFMYSQGLHRDADRA